MMEHEYECKAFVDGKLVDVVATYEIDFPDTLIYGIFLAEPPISPDVTDKIHPDEFDRIYTEINARAFEDMACAAETYFEGNR